MKKILILLSAMTVFASCNNAPQQQSNDPSKTIDMNVKNKSFDELFTKVDSTQVKETLAKLMVEDGHTVLTAGTETQFNSMMASWEIMGQYFRQPMTFCMLGANRYTLKFIRQQQTYTMSFFPEEFRDDIMQFGTKSGRTTNKMKETNLTYVKTPSGCIAYKEANVVIECRLFEITTVNPKDFYTEDGKKFVEDALQEAKDYHKLIFGTITNVWVRK